ncbi:proenkephalin-A [Oncorhynchus tshawytscha]|uniref:Synenkephalin n=1 Tax=Oncorhynchus tshawytscha TaxID=74940 RepID=A0A8C8HJU3_ONCTS|nr:proenkephalin-A [Oncorhynchus tshawytscha]
MAVPGNSLWRLLLCAYFALTVGADCEKDCALCLNRILGQQTVINTLTCSIECEGSLDTTKLRLCRDVLLEEEPVAVDEIKQEGVEGEQHQLAKKYGGFMKRYGGFMIRRSPPVQDGGVQGGQNSPVVEEEDIRLEILKILNSEAEAQRDGELAKRYGGFMRRGGDFGALEVAGRPLKKRYGGFMRRVGRPEWLEDQKNKGGLLKRSWEGQGVDSPLAEIQKKYGGFMD